MGRSERWLLPGILALIGLPFLIVGGVVWRLVPQNIANHVEEVARLPVATADSLNERGTRVLIEGRVGDRMAFSDRPPLVVYNEYHWVKDGDDWEWQLQRSYTPTLWMQIPGGEVEVAAGYGLRSTPAQLESRRDRRYEGFRVNDPVLVLGTLRVAGTAPVVDQAQVGFETKETYLLSLQQGQATAQWLGLLFLGLGGAITLGALAAVYFLGSKAHSSGS